MPIRLVDDDDKPKSNSGGGSSSSGGGGNKDDGKGAIAIVLLILFGLFKFPKTTITLLLVAGVCIYFWGDPKWFGMEAWPGQSARKESGSKYSMGCELNQELYDATDVFEPLDVENNQNELPSRVTLEQYAPKRRNQGQQGSCVGWASSYAARTIVEAHATGKNPDEVAFSPAFLYNQIALENCEGTYTSKALETLKEGGDIYLSEFPYDENSCSNQPNQSQLDEAQRHRIRGYNRLTQSGDDYDVDIDGIKQNIAQGGPVIIAMKVPPSYSYVEDNDTWKPESGEAGKVESYGGHAQCVIGYDDNKNGGSVLVMNSWGDDWGKNGLVWINYKDFHTFCREAYGVFPDKKSKNVSQDKFHIKFGLWEEGLAGEEGKERYMPLEQKSDFIFTNAEPLAKGTRFKIAVKNSIDCYLYIFATDEESNSTVLFPYDKFSPYFGITGTRMFPKDKDFMADDIGERDFMAIVATKEPIDEAELNRKINNSRQKTFPKKVLDAVRDQAIPKVNWELDDKGVNFEGKSQGKNALVVIYEFTKE